MKIIEDLLMKKLLILALCVLMVACSSTPSVEESNAEYVMDDADTIEDLNGIEDVNSLEDVAENEPLDEEMLEVEGSSMQHDLTESDSKAESALTPHEEIRNLRLEIEELKLVIIDLRNAATSSANMEGANFQAQDDSHNVRPVDLVMKFDSMYDQKRWWNILEEAGIKDKFYSTSNGQYLIFLGHFNDHKFALATKNKIIKATGAEAIEIITSTGG